MKIPGVPTNTCKMLRRRGFFGPTEHDGKIWIVHQYELQEAIKLCRRMNAREKQARYRRKKETPCKQSA